MNNIDVGRGCIWPLVITMPTGGKFTHAIGTCVAYQESSDKIWLVTAGHVLTEFRRLVREHGASHFRVLDGHLDTGVPLTLDPAIARSDECALSRRDAGAVLLAGNQIDNLRTNPAFSPLTSEDVAAYDVFKRERYQRIVVVGYPYLWSDDRRALRGDQVSVRTSMKAVEIPVANIGDVERFADLAGRVTTDFWSHQCLYSEISLDPAPGDPSLDDIMGVSGGPILMQCADGRWVWIGVQSTWVKALKLLRWNPIDEIARFMTAQQW